MKIDAVPMKFLGKQLPPSRPINERTVALNTQIEDLISHQCVVAIGVSGGKDSDACALAVIRHLDSVGHTGPRVLIHSDLGSIEWKDSLPSCERLAESLGIELMVVKRNAGDMMARWKGRWSNNVKRYSVLSCVKLILPWSTPSMRFCTSELKTAVITSALRKRFPSEAILNVVGVRRQESANRAKMPVSATMAKLERKNAVGVSWNAIIEWQLQDVLQEISDAGLRLHEAYTTYGTSRVSCVMCIMSSEQDLIAAANCADNEAVYRELVDLEATSGFGFQGNRWLADVAPHLLDASLKARVQRAKEGAALRVQIEAEIPAYLLYVKGWPVSLPTPAQAELLASVRQRVAAAVGIDVGFTTGAAVMARYAELLAAKADCRGDDLHADFQSHPTDHV